MKIKKMKRFASLVCMCMVWAGAARAGALTVDAGQKASASPIQAPMSGKRLAARETAVAAVMANQAVPQTFISQWFEGFEAAGATPTMREVVSGERYDVAFVKSPDGSWVKMSRKIVAGEPSGKFEESIRLAKEGGLDPRLAGGGGIGISVAPRGVPGNGGAAKVDSPRKDGKTVIEKVEKMR